ncbi:hypothetical protein [Lacipirellula parvula]|uniref:Uncharacterized protein n=1 Tax=Lacipirellula parvula TaxID=2650471 RepID=A0A5K7XGU4_9BACT|nr:hypothetical protein [Lacipirellula parvula]BBO35262.1 hypothetical protein PLANPX_4874 [Lacipirellula parvula]
MSPHAPGPIEQFVAFVRRRVNLHLLWTTLIWTAAAGAGLVTAVSLVYVLQGYAVPGGWIVATLLATACGGAAAWFWHRLSDEQAARYVDRFYGLKDSVASYLHFTREGRRDGFYELQANYTQRQVGELSPEAIAYRAPRRGLMLAAGLTAVALPLSLRGPSDEVVQRQQQEQAVQQATETSNKELLEMVEELREEVKDPFEKELVDPDKLRKMVESLEATKDQKEALRQYAQLERELNKARMAIQRKKDEQLLEKAAEKLQEDRESKQLGEQLQQKKYDKAADELASMQTEPNKPLSEQRKQLAKLKAASQRMAAAAKANKSASQGKESKSGEQSNSKSAAAKDAKGGSGASGESGASSGSSGGELGENLEELAASVQKLDESLAEAERQERETGKCDSKSQSQCQACQASVDKQLNKLCQGLCKLGIRREADKKLCKLCEKCSNCQSMCNGLCQSPNAGGKKAGTGTNTARRNATDELVDNGQTTQLQGQKGAGPSLTTVESADEGSGVSNRRTAAKQREFKRQFESFVEREDVPAQVRDGVKNYFQLIHQMESTPAVEAEGDAAE